MFFIKRFFKYTFSVLFLLFLLGFVISTTNVMPKNAKVYVNDTKKLYYAPTYLQDNLMSTDNLRLTTSKYATDNKYNPDSDCRDKGYFMQDGRSLTGTMLEKLGVLKKIKSRWDDNGNWLY